MLKVVGEKFREAVMEAWGDISYVSMVCKDGVLPAALSECADPHNCVHCFTAELPLGEASSSLEPSF